MTGIHILLFRRPIRLRTVNIPTCLYIFFDAFSAYLKNNFKPEPGNRAESLYTRENWKDRHPQMRIFQKYGTWWTPAP